MEASKGAFGVWVFLCFFLHWYFCILFKKIDYSKLVGRIFYDDVYVITFLGKRRFWPKKMTKKTVLSSTKEKKSLLSTKSHFRPVKVSSLHSHLQFFILILLQSGKSHFCPSKSQFCQQSKWYVRCLMCSCPSLLLTVYFVRIYFTTVTSVHEMHYPHSRKRCTQPSTVTINRTISYRSNVQLTPPPCKWSTSFVRETQYYVGEWEQRLDYRVVSPQTKSTWLIFGHAF